MKRTRRVCMCDVVHLYPYIPHQHYFALGCNVCTSHLNGFFHPSRMNNWVIPALLATRNIAVSCFVVVGGERMPCHPFLL